MKLMTNVKRFKNKTLNIKFIKLTNKYTFLTKTVQENYCNYDVKSN